MQTYPKTPAQFRRQAEKGFARVNPDAEGLTFEWTFGPKRVTYPTGLQGFCGHGVVRADGYRPSSFSATADREGGLMVRASGGGFLRDAAERIVAARR